MSIYRYNEKPLSQVKQENEAREKPLQTLEAELATLKAADQERETLIQALGQELALVKLELIGKKGGEGA